VEVKTLAKRMKKAKSQTKRDKKRSQKFIIFWSLTREREGVGRGGCMNYFGRGDFLSASGN
jgi:hypothetical protein